MAATLGITSGLSWGDLASTANLAAFSFCFTLNKVSANLNDDYGGQWGGNNLTTGFLVYNSTSGQVALAVGISGSWIRIWRCQLSSTIIGLNRVFVRWQPGQHQININGLDQTFVEDANVGVETTIGDSTAAFHVGYRNESPSNPGVVGDYSEVGLWGIYVPDSVVDAYMKGFSLHQARVGGLLYAPVYNIISCNDIWAGNSGVNLNGTSAAHPPIILPRRRGLILKPGAVSPPPPPSVLLSSGNKLPLLGVG